MTGMKYDILKNADGPSLNGRLISNRIISTSRTACQKAQGGRSNVLMKSHDGNTQNALNIIIGSRE